MIKTKCKKCNNRLTIFNEDRVWTDVCKDCGHVDRYTHEDKPNCKKCGSERLVYPDLKVMVCPKCKNKGEYEIEEISIRVDNPETVETGTHKWAIFIAASNFPEDNESKLGNGALNLAEYMSTFFIEELGYSTCRLSSAILRS